MRTALGAVLAALVGFLAPCPLTAADTGATRSAPANWVGTWTRDAVTLRVFENGLRLVVKENRAAPIVWVQVMVRAGSETEQEFTGAGITHLCEHLLCHVGTASRSAEDWSRRLRRAGVRMNGSTGGGSTNLLAAGPPESIEIALDALSGRVANAVISADEVQREKELIAREREMRRAEPEGLMTALAGHNEFLLHPARHPVLGYTEAIAGVTRDDVVRYYRRTYVPQNMVVSVVGDIDAGRVLAAAQERFGRLPPRPAPAAALPPEPPQTGRRYLEIDAPVHLALMRMAFRTVGFSHRDVYSLDVIEAVLSAGGTGRLTQRLQNQEKLARSVSTRSRTFRAENGHFIVELELPGENLEKAEWAVMDELDRLRTQPLTDLELARAKKQNKASVVYNNESPESQAYGLAQDVLLTGTPFFDQDVYLPGIEMVTAADVTRAAIRYFRTDNLTVTVVRPRAPAAARATARLTTRPREAVSAVRRVVLPNGLVLLLERRPEAGYVTVQTAFRGGLRIETPETAGVSRVTARLITSGTPTRSGYAIDRYLDAIGARCFSGSTLDYLFARTDVLAEDFAPAMEVIADSLLNPTFPEVEFAKARRNALTDLDGEGDDPFAEAYGAFRSAFYRRGSYRRSILGTRDALERLTVEDVRTHYRRWCVANNAIVAVFGDIDLDAAEATVRKHFGRMRSDAALRLPAPVPEAPLDRDVVVTQSTDKDQAVIYFGFRGMDAGSASDRAAVDVLRSLLQGTDRGDESISRSIRGGGLAYSVGVFNQLGIDSGCIGGYLMCRPDQVDKAVAALRANLEGVRAGDVAADQLDGAKRISITVEARRMQSAAERAQQALLAETWGWAPDAADQYPAQLAAVSAADVRRAAQKYLTHWVLVVLKPGPVAASRSLPVSTP